MEDAGAGVGILFVLLFLVLLVVVLLLPKLQMETPAVEGIRFRPGHADARHGSDAQKARDRVRGCGPADIRAKLCPASSEYGLTVAFWCQPPGASVCPGVYTTIAGIEKTSFIRPCYQWESCQ
jgi:hypothetical protein